MNFCLDRNSPGWPAQWRFCLALGLRPNFDGPPSEAFSFKKAIRSYLSARPIYQWGKVLQAIEEYYACLCYIRYLNQSAERVADAGNEDFVLRILEQGRVSLAHSQKEEWPELAGLWNQKLLHLRYYEELFGKK